MDGEELSWEMQEMDLCVQTYFSLFICVNSALVFKYVIT